MSLLLCRSKIFCLALLLLGASGLQAAPLHEAVKEGNKAKVEALLAQGEDLNAKDGDDFLPLHSAVDAAKPEMVELLLAHGAAVDGRGVSSRGMTPLHLAGFRGLKAIAEQLLAKGAEINAKSASGQTPLGYAVNNGRKDVVEMLVGKGAEVYAQDSDGTTIVHECAGNGGEYYQSMLVVLLSRGAGPDGRDRYGRTPLHLATFYGNRKAAELLLAKGADVDAASVSGITALFKSTINTGVADVFRLLLAKGASVNVRDKDGVTPLHNAARDGTGEIIELLLVKGAVLEAENIEGRTPLDYAALGGNKDNYALLRSKVASLPLSARAEAAIQMGIAHARVPDYARAIGCFETARLEAPYSPLPLYYLGLAESKIAGRELRAICWFKAFLAASPASPKAEAVTAEIANLEMRSREVLLDLVKTATTAADLLPPPAANEPQDPEGTPWDYTMRSVALLWARTGNADMAIQRAGRVSHPFLRTLTATQIAGPLASAGELERSKRAIATAVSSAERLERSDDQANALASAAAHLANLGDAPGALVIAARIDDAGLRCQAHASVARAQASAGDFVAAAATAEAIPVHYFRSATQAFIARIAAESADRDTAARLLDASKASLAGVVYDVNATRDIGMRPAVLKPGRGYNLEGLKRGVMIQEYAPREPVTPPQSVNEANRQSFDISGLTLDNFITGGLIRDLDMTAARSYVQQFHAQALSELCVARARTGDIAGAKAIVNLADYSDFQPYLDKRWMANARVGIARGHALLGDEATARMQLAAARILAAPEEARMIAEASNPWIAANEYLLNDTVFTALPEHLKGLPNTFAQQTFSALADTARTLADAQAVVFAPRSRPLYP